MAPPVGRRSRNCHRPRGRSAAAGPRRGRAARLRDICGNGHVLERRPAPGGRRERRETRARRRLLGLRPALHERRDARGAPRRGRKGKSRGSKVLPPLPAARFPAFPAGGRRAAARPPPGLGLAIQTVGDRCSRGLNCSDSLAFLHALRRLLAVAYLNSSRISEHSSATPSYACFRSPRSRRPFAWFCRRKSTLGSGGVAQRLHRTRLRVAGAA